MTDICVVVEGRSDVAILRPILNKTIGLPFRFFVGEGRLNLVTIGRNILVHEGNPVLVVMDAKTFDVPTGEETCGMARMALRQFSSEDWSDSFAFVPEIEVIFFEAASLLDRRGVDPAVVERGRYRPKATLTEVLNGLGQTLRAFADGWTDEDIADLRDNSQAGQFLRVAERLVSAADDGVTSGSAANQEAP